VVPWEETRTGRWEGAAFGFQVLGSYILREFRQFGGKPKIPFTLYLENRFDCGIGGVRLDQ
jgi:hypothetical protein